MIPQATHSNIKIIFLLAIIMLLVLSFSSYIRIKTLVDESDLVTHTQAVKLELGKMHAVLNEVESGQRGFIITQDSVFLQPVFSAQPNLDFHLRQVAALTKDNPDQQRNVAALRQAVYNRLDFLKKILNDARTSVIPADRWVKGKILMDRVSDEIEKMEAEENSLLQVREANLKTSIYFTPLFSIFLIISAIIIIVAAYFKIMHEARKSDVLKSEAVAAANKIKERENRIQSILEAAPDAVVTIDHKGIITNWNVEAERIFGWDKNEAIGNTLTDTIIPERYREQHRIGLNRFLNSGEGRILNKPIEIHAVKKDNTEIPVELKISASVLHDNNPVFIGFLRDISIRRRAETEIENKTIELTAANNELEKANKELESFNYISSHDLQEPLRKIQSFASRITSVEQENLSEKGKEYFNKINDAANRMQTLIEDLLAYSRTKSEDRPFEITDLNLVMKEVVLELKEIIDEKDAVVEVGNLSAANVIPFQFHQMMHNLIGNALKFSKPGISPRILIRNEMIITTAVDGLGLPAGKDYCHITVRDNGIGFDTRYKDRIFEVFQRLHDKQKIKGTGIGLAIVKKIVENHNGIITATGEIDKGATFDIYIPAAPRRSPVLVPSV